MPFDSWGLLQSDRSPKGQLNQKGQHME